MRRRGIALLAALAVAVAVGGAVARPARLLAGAPYRAAHGQLERARLDTGHGIRLLPRLSDGVVETAASDSPTGATRSNAAANGSGAGASTSTSTGPTPGSNGCSSRNPGGMGDVRVNQDCTYRAQAEETIAANPANPQNLVAGMNDWRQGFNYGAFAYSLDGGRTWGDGPPSFYQKLNAPDAELPTASDPNSHTITGQPGNGFTYDGGSDPMVAFDLEGRAYFGLVLLDRGGGSGSAIVVTQSPSGAGGSFFATPTPFSRHWVITEDNDPGVFNDKPLLAADTFTHSPNRDNLYVTWAVFHMDLSTGAFMQSPIYASISTDHALTWSTPEPISGSSSTLCFFGDAFQPGLDPHSCNFSSGAVPVPLPNGDLEVVFNNGNAPSGANGPDLQQLAVHCRPSGSSPAGTAHMNCDSPVKVGNDVQTGIPQCDIGRGNVQPCAPGVDVSVVDFPTAAVNAGNGDLYAAWNDYRGGEFDIRLSRSTDGGRTWTESQAPVNSDRGADHYQPAIGVVCSGAQAAGGPLCARSGDSPVAASANDDGGTLCPSTSQAQSRGAIVDAGGDDHVAVSYYRTCRVPNETLPPGCVYFGSPPCPIFAPGQPGVQAEPSDYTLAGGRGLRTPYASRPVSPAFPPPVGTRQTGFMGDYSGIAVVGDTAHPIWSDPRNAIPPALRDPDQPAVDDEDIFTIAAAVPGAD